jgi:Skp family chaperone for outer membrane proteins
MEIDFRKKKKVVNEDFAEEDTCKEFEEDAQAYYKGLRARKEKEKTQKEIEKKKLSEEEQKKRKEREEYYKEIKAIYRKKASR